jgi:hypothetical protein
MWPFDDLSSELNFSCNKDVRYHIATHRMNRHDWKHHVSCLNIVKIAGGISQDNVVKIQNLMRIKMKKENAHCEG